MVLINKVRPFSVGVVLAASCLLAACGGGGSTKTYTVGGNVTGLAGSGLVLRNNGGDALNVSADGSFTFATAVKDRQNYAVTVATQPSATPPQTCVVSNGTGTLAGAAVTNVSVSCATSTYAIGGSVTGLNTSGLVLQNNGGDNLSLSASGSFTFATKLTHGDSYQVSILTQPNGGVCELSQGAGDATSTVTRIAVSCQSYAATPTLSLDYGIKTLKFSWPAAAHAEQYYLLENPDGQSEFTRVGEAITGTAVDHEIALYNRVNAQYQLQACNALGCATSAPVAVSENLVEAIGYFKASNTDADDYFGRALALSADGTTLVVGAFGDDSGAKEINGDQSDNSSETSGAVYVFVKTSTGWVQEAYIKGSRLRVNDRFGESLGLSADGNLLAVGAAEDDSLTTGIDPAADEDPDPERKDVGAVYIFSRTEGGWMQQSYIKPSNSHLWMSFGRAVSLSADGKTLAVAATGDSSDPQGVAVSEGSPFYGSGSVFMFSHGDAGWVQDALLKASNPGRGDLFGRALSLSGDGSTLAVGARNEDSSARGINGDQSDNSAGDAGAVYVFSLDAQGWSQQAYIKAANAEDYDQFGSSVSLSYDGNTLAVGAPYEDSNATGLNGDMFNNLARYSGAAYVFTRMEQSWQQQAYLKAAINTSEYFGRSVALSSNGDSLLVGVSCDNSQGLGVLSAPGLSNGACKYGTGAAYLFKLDAEQQWFQHLFIKAASAGNERCFGRSVLFSSDGATIAVSDECDANRSLGTSGNQSDLSAPYSGAVYLY